MGEKLTPAEEKKEISREQVIAAFRKFADSGIKHPGDLYPNDPDVSTAQDLYNQWVAQEDERAQGSPERLHQNNLAGTMLYIDAGFTDPDYLDEVFNDFLVQEVLEIEQPTDEPDRPDTRTPYKNADEVLNDWLGPDGIKPSDDPERTATREQYRDAIEKLLDLKRQQSEQQSAGS